MMKFQNLYTCTVQCTGKISIPIGTIYLAARLLTFYLENYYPPRLGQHNTIRYHTLGEGERDREKEREREI